MRFQAQTVKINSAPIASFYLTRNDWGRSAYGRYHSDGTGKANAAMNWAIL